MSSIYQWISTGLASILLILGVAYAFNNSKLKDVTNKYEKLQIEKALSDIQIETFKSSIKVQNDKIKTLGILAEKHQEVIVKESIRIDLKYKDRYIQVYDLNETEECKALERIIDEEFNTTSTTTI